MQPAAVQAELDALDQNSGDLLNLGGSSDSGLDYPWLERVTVSSSVEDVIRILELPYELAQNFRGESAGHSD